MSFLAEQRRAQQLCIVAVSLCLDRPRTIQDIETFFVEHNERLEVTELYDVLMYAIGKQWLEYFADPGYPTRYRATAQGRAMPGISGGTFDPESEYEMGRGTLTP